MRSGPPAAETANGRWRVAAARLVVTAPRAQSLEGARGRARVLSGGDGVAAFRINFLEVDSR